MTRPRVQHTSVVETADIGANTSIGHFSHVASNARIGDDCVIHDHVVIGSDAAIGNNVVIESGARLCGDIVVEDGVHVGVNVTLDNSRHDEAAPSREPRSMRTTVRAGARIGSAATLLSGVTVGIKSFVAPGSVVTQNVPPNAVVSGNPAHIVGYASSSRATNALATPQERRRQRRAPATTVPAVKLFELPIVKDLRGTLSVAEYDKTLPFIPKRYFVVYDVSNYEVRGEHAHKRLQQFLVCVRGSGAVVVDDGEYRDEILLDSPGIGLYLPPMIWATQYKFSPDAVLLVLADDVYKADDYIRDYDEYLVLKEGK